MPKDFFFEVFFIFFEFFQKKVKMASAAVRWKGSIFSKLLTVLWNNHYFCTLKWFLKKFQSKLSHTCSSNLNYFQKINIKSFKCTKLGRNRENHNIWVLSIKYGLICVKIGWVPFCIIFCVLASQIKSFFALRKWRMILIKVI